MKRLILALLILSLLSIQTALADIDLSGMTFDELVALKDQINLAIWNSEEWQEVTVPQGRWIVGEDIPAGKWTVKCADINRDEFDMSMTRVEYGEYLEDDNEISYNGRHDVEWIYSPDHRVYESGQVTEVIFELRDGDIFEVDTEYAPAVFSPYAGKPSLGFK